MGIKGNQFWKNRTKHGRNRIFSTPNMLWKAACEYFKWCDDNPLIEIDYKGKDAERVEIPKMRAYTLRGLCTYLGVNEAYLRQFEAMLSERNDDLLDDFSTIITRIRDVIFVQKFEGAAAGLLNSNLIARDLSLVDRSDVTSGDEKMSAVTSINAVYNGEKIEFTADDLRAE